MIQVKLFDCEHEQDLEDDMNRFLKSIDPEQFIDIKYHIAAISDDREQIYCFSGMILYEK